MNTIGTRRRRSPWIVLLAPALLALAACGNGGISDEDAQAIRDDLATVEQRLDDIEAQMNELESGEADQEAIASAVRDALEEARSTTEEAREELDAAGPDPAVEEGAGDPLAPAETQPGPQDPNQPADF